MFKISLTIFLIFTFSYIKLKETVYTENKLLLGSSLPKSGIMKDWGKSVYNGANAYFQYTNDNNILSNNKTIELLTYDDKYEPELTLENINKLSNHKNLFSFFGFVGTPTVKNILPNLEKNSIPFIAPFTGASFLRNPQYKNFINFRSSYSQEIDKIVGYLNENKKITKFAIFYQNDNYGEEGYVALINALEKRDLKLQGEGMYKRNTLSIRHAFSEIKENKPEAILMIGAYKANAHFIKKAKKDNILKDVIFCNISFSDANEMIKELKHDTKNLLFSQVVPNYNNENIEVIKEYKTIMNQYYPNERLGFISLESFLAAKTIVHAIKNIDGNITHTNFLEELKNIPDDVLKGIKLKYKDTQLLNRTYLFEYKNNDFREIEYD